MFSFDQRHRLPDEVAAVESQELTAEQQQQDLFEAHRHRVFSVSYYMTANEAEAETILTDTFIGAFQQTPVPNWDHVDEALLQELEARFSFEPAAPATVDGSLQLPRGQVKRTDLEEAVGVLPPRERLIFLLRDVEGYPPAKIAGLLVCGEQDVLRTLISARIRMRNALGRLQTREVVIPLADEVPEAAMVGR